MNNYIKIKKPNHPFALNDGNVFEHRLVVEEKIGRYLKKQEVIHHIDFNKKNNKIENLMIFDNQKEYMKFHIKFQQFGITNPIRLQILNRWVKHEHN